MSTRKSATGANRTAVKTVTKTASTPVAKKTTTVTRKKTAVPAKKVVKQEVEELEIAEETLVPVNDNSAPDASWFDNLTNDTPAKTNWADMMDNENSGEATGEDQEERIIQEGLNTMGKHIRERDSNGRGRGGHHNNGHRNNGRRNGGHYNGGNGGAYGNQPNVHPPSYAAQLAANGSYQVPAPYTGYQTGQGSQPLGYQASGYQAGYQQQAPGYVGQGQYGGQYFGSVPTGASYGGNGGYGGQRNYGGRDGGRDGGRGGRGRGGSRQFAPRSNVFNNGEPLYIQDVETGEVRKVLIFRTDPNDPNAGNNAVNNGGEQYEQE